MCREGFLARTCTCNVMNGSLEGNKRYSTKILCIHSHTFNAYFGNDHQTNIEMHTQKQLHFPQEIQSFGAMTPVFRQYEPMP